LNESLKPLRSPTSSAASSNVASPLLLNHSIMREANQSGIFGLPVLRQSAHRQTARPPIGARHRSGSGNAITELGHHLQVHRQTSACTVPPGLFNSSHCASAVCLTIWSSGRPQTPFVGTLRAAHSGAAYRER